MKKYLCLMMIMVFILSLSGCGKRNAMFYQDWMPESTPVPYCEKGMVYFGDAKLDISKVLKENYEEYCRMISVLLMKDTKIYFLFNREEYDNYLASIDTVTKEINILQSIDSQFRCSIHDCFYLNGDIVLRGEEKTLIYNVENDTTTYVDKDFEIPRKDFSYTCSEEENSLTFKPNGETGNENAVVLKFDDMLSSTYGEDLKKLRDEKVLGGYKRTDVFFQRVEVINDEIYIIADAEYFFYEVGLIYKYDEETGKLYFVEGLKSLISMNDVHVVPFESK